MPTATATKAPVFDHVKFAETLRRIVAELGTNLIERREQVEAVMLTLLSGMNAILLGPPGAAKSLLIHEFANRIRGARYFDVLLDKQMGKEEIFGQIDLPLYDKTGVWERDTADYLPGCHIALLDEVGKAGPAVINTMLQAMEERTFRNGSRVEQLDALSYFGATNELLDDQNAAAWDRFLVRMYVDYIQDDGNFMALIASAVQDGSATATNPTTVDIDDLRQAIAHIPTITLPIEIQHKVADMRTKMRNSALKVSDRRWHHAIHVVQSSAYLAGRSTVDEDDLQVLTHILWSHPDERRQVETMVSEYVSKFVAASRAMEATVDEVNKELTSRKGQSRADLATYGSDANFNLDQARVEILDLMAQARAAGKNVTPLEKVATEIRTAQIRVLTECMHLGEDGARAGVEKQWSEASVSSKPARKARRV